MSSTATVMSQFLISQRPQLLGWQNVATIVHDVIDPHMHIRQVKVEPAKSLAADIRFLTDRERPEDVPRTQLIK
jgi:hypothetical protein